MASTSQGYNDQAITNQTSSVITSSLATTTRTTATAANTTSVEVATAKTGLNDGEIAGIAVGVICCILIIVAIIVFIVIRRRKHHGESVSDGERIDVEINKSVEPENKRKENKYVKKNSPNSGSQVYENPDVDQENYENVPKNDDSQPNRSTKHVVQKQDSIPTAPAPPPPIDRTSMPVDKASTCSVTEDEDYIFPEDPSKFNVKPPLYNKRKPENNEKKIYLDMGSYQSDETYMNPDSTHNQESYMNFDVQTKHLENEERKEGLKDYVNLSNQEKGAAFGVRPKEIHETTTPVTKSDERSYQNVLYKNESKQNKKPRRKK